MIAVRPAGLLEEPADLLGERVPGADRLVLQAAPRQLHQVERGEEVGVEPLGGVQHPLLGQPVPVAEQHVLEVAGAGLGGADVEQDPSAHGASSGLGVSAADSSSRSARSSVSATSGLSTPARSTGSTSAGSPCTG